MAVDANGVEILEVVVPLEPVIIPDSTVAIPAVIAPVIAPAAIPKPESTGNVYFDTVQNAIHEKGIAPDKYAKEFAETGAVTPESRAELVAALGEAQVVIIENGMTAELGKIRSTQDANAKLVYDSIALPGYADGKAAFAVIGAWALENIPVEERNEYNAMLGKGGVQANLAVKALKERYMADPSFTVQADLINGTAVPLSQGPELISRSTYTAELRKANNSRDKVAIQKLNERANYTMQNNRAAWRP